MAEVARRADMGDKTLFRALSESGNPTLSTVHKVLHAVGLRVEQSAVVIAFVILRIFVDGCIEVAQRLIVIFIEHVFCAEAI